jgi:hypothetical protein
MAPENDGKDCKRRIREEKITEQRRIPMKKLLLFLGLTLLLVGWGGGFGICPALGQQYYQDPYTGLIYIQYPSGEVYVQDPRTGQLYVQDPRTGQLYYIQNPYANNYYNYYAAPGPDPNMAAVFDNLGRYLYDVGRMTQASPSPSRPSVKTNQKCPPGSIVLLGVCSNVQSPPKKR